MNDDALILLIGAIGLGIFSVVAIINDSKQFFYDNGFGSLDFELAGFFFFIGFYFLARWYGEESNLMVTTKKVSA